MIWKGDSVANLEASVRETGISWDFPWGQRCQRAPFLCILLLPCYCRGLHIHMISLKPRACPTEVLIPSLTKVLLCPCYHQQTSTVHTRNDSRLPGCGGQKALCSWAPQDYNKQEDGPGQDTTPRHYIDSRIKHTTGLHMKKKPI